jgi:broad specificity phosphatase PhoE
VHQEQRLAVLRHGEAQKNVEDRHGGPGSFLTEVGRAQMAVAARRLSVLCGGPCDVWSDGTLHVAEAAAIVAHGLGVTPTHHAGLRGISLGVLAGLSTAEAETRHPKAAASLVAWRLGLIRSHELDIPGKESIGDFEARVRSAFDEIVGTSRPAAAIVTSRSTAIMLANILTLGCRFSPDLYFAYDVPNGAIGRWRRERGRGWWAVVGGATWEPDGL